LSKRVGSARSVVATAVLLAAVALGAVSCTGSETDGVTTQLTGVKQGGPLAEPRNRTRTSAPVELGKPYSWGSTYVENRGTEPATIDSLVPVGRQGPLQVLGIYALPFPNDSHIGLVEGYKEAGDPPTGLQIDGGKTVQLVVGLEVSSQGRYAVRGMRLRYHVGAQHYETTTPHWVALCAPPSVYAKCPSDPF
jgi:hypothetical protein